MHGTRLAGDRRNSGDIGTFHCRVGRRFGKDHPRVIAHGCRNVVRVGGVGEGVVDTEAAQDLGAQPIRAPVGNIRDDGVRAGFEECEHRCEYRTHASAETGAVDAALEIGEFEFERLDCRVARARVGESLAQVFIDRRLHVGRRLIDRREDRAGRRIRRDAGMDLACAKAHGEILFYASRNCNGSSASTPGMNCCLRSRLVSW